MKKDRKELLRAQSLIEGDRLNAGDNFMELLRFDLDKLLKDYFDFSGLPNIKIERQGDCFRVNFDIVLKRIKVFEYIPKD